MPLLSRSVPAVVCELINVWQVCKLYSITFYLRTDLDFLDRITTEVKEKGEFVIRFGLLSQSTLILWEHHLSYLTLQYLSICLSYLSVCRRSVCFSVYLSVCLSVCLSVSLCLSVRLSFYLSICPSICPSICLSIHPSICPCISVCLSVHPCIFFPLSILAPFLFLHPSPCTSLRRTRTLALGEWNPLHIANLKHKDKKAKRQSLY